MEVFVVRLAIVLQLHVTLTHVSLRAASRLFDSENATAYLIMFSSRRP